MIKFPNWKKRVDEPPKVDGNVESQANTDISPMDNQDLASLRIGTDSTHGVVTAVTSELATTFSGATQRRVVIEVKVASGNHVKLSDAWVWGRNGKVAVQSLWLSLDPDGHVRRQSAVAKVMRFYDVSELGQLVGRKVEMHSKPNGFLAIVAVDAPDDLERFGEPRQTALAMVHESSDSRHK